MVDTGVGIVVDIVAAFVEEAVDVIKTGKPEIKHPQVGTSRTLRDSVNTAVSDWCTYRFTTRSASQYRRW